MENWRKILIIIILIGCGFGIYIIIKDKQKRDKSPTATQSIAEIPPSAPAPEAEPAETAKEPQPTIKSEVLLNIPFTSQAPYADWDTLHNEACEEASVIMVNEFLNGNTDETIPAAEAEKQIQEMVAWEIETIGSHKDLTAQETVNYLVKRYLERPNAKVYDFSIDNIKQKLSAGIPVIVPAAGRLLGNPNYKQPGPIYHMLVIKGYDDKHFITNDAGTRRGRSYEYTFDRVEYAAHDWNGSPDNINSGPKVFFTLN